MTRKRFIKLLISYGIPRNEAVKIAADYNSRNIPYEIAYKRLIFVRLTYKFKRSAIGSLRRLKGMF